MYLQHEMPHEIPSIQNAIRFHSILRPIRRRNYLNNNG